MKKDTFFIGELSDMFDISVDSLRYYEKMGLLHPKRNPDNDYRQYSMEDFQTIVVIRELLGLGFHMKQIQDFLANRSLDSTIQLLTEEIDVISQRILTLYEQKTNLQSRLLAIQHTMLADIDEQVRLIHLPKRPGIMISEENLPDSYVDYSMVQYVKKKKLEINAIGFCDCYTLDIQGSNPNSDYYRTENVFFLTGEAQTSDGFCLPAGDYLSLYYRGSLKKTKKLMPRLFDYAKTNHLSISGSPMELCHIDSYETSYQEEYVIELQLPVTVSSCH